MAATGTPQIPLVDRSVRRRRLDSLDSGSALQAAVAGEPCSRRIDPDLADNGDATWVTVFPLSSAQERMWFLDQIDSGNPTYTVRRAYRVVGDLDPDALQRALDRLVERHDSLRTRVLARDGTLAVAVEDTGEWPLRVVDVSTYSDPVGQVQRLARDDAVQVFDLERGPLAVATAYRLGDRDWVLIVRLHHVVVDGWSLDVLFDELSLAYPSPTSGWRDPNSAQPGLSYSDFAVWQHEVLDRETLQRQLDYWRGTLAGIPDSLDVPTDHPRPRVPSSEGRRRSAALGSPLTGSIRTLAQQCGTTPFAVLFAACTAVLSRLSGQDDIVLGTVVAGRHTPDVQRSVGLFANTLLLRADAGGNPSVRGTGAQVLRAPSSEAQANQDLPFERLVEELHPERDIGRNPLFQVMINLQPPATVRGRA